MSVAQVSFWLVSSFVLSFKQDFNLYQQDREMINLIFLHTHKNIKSSNNKSIFWVLMICRSLFQALSNINSWQRIIACEVSITMSSTAHTFIKCNFLSEMAQNSNKVVPDTVQGEMLMWMADIRQKKKKILWMTQGNHCLCPPLFWLFSLHEEVLASHWQLH